jgi:hypothetical protein
MPRPPRQKITPHIANQLSDVVRMEYPRFVHFLEAYYNWLETAGAVVFRGKIVNVLPQAIVLPQTASPNDHAYNGLFVVVENGPAKGHTRRVVGYDGATRMLLLETAWEEGQFPASNSRVVLRDSLHPQRLEDYSNVDNTLDEFVEEFSQQFLSQLPGTTLADKRRLIKRIKDFNRSRGTEKSFQLLFRILYDSEAEFYYPKVDLFRTSDNHWYVERVVRIPATEENRAKLFGWRERRLIGETSGATAKIELSVLMRVGAIQYFELYLSNIDGNFFAAPINPMLPDAVNQLAEPVKIIYPFEPEQSTEPQGEFYRPGGSLEEPRSITEYDQPYRILIAIDIIEGGDEYAVGDLIDVTGCSLLPGKGIITSVETKLFRGRCSPPPEGGYFEPYFGPDTAWDDYPTFPNPQQIGTWGKHFWSDVNIVLTEDQIISDNEIQLATNESGIDDFFRGFDITLTNGTGKGQTRKILSYDGINKVALVDTPWDVLPDTSTEYSIFKTRGAAKKAKVIDPGLGFYCDPTVDFSPSPTGTGATGRAVLGVVNEAPGKFLNRKSFANSDKIIQDSHYWQDFSYDIRSGEMLSRYRDVAKALLHPAGMMMFGSVYIKSIVNKKPFHQTVREWIIELGNKFFDDTQIDFARRLLIKWTSYGGVIGGTYGRFGSERKFRLFHPNENFNLQYPPPNEQYYRGSVTANTQIAHFQNRTIYDFVNFPKRRFTLAGDSFIKIDNTEGVGRAGIVGVSMRTIERAKFYGFPPFDGFNQTYPPPNEVYWATNVANTQISAFQNVRIDRAAISSSRNRNNIVGDAYINITSITSGVPLIGNLIEYDFLQGFDDQLIYNVSPNGGGLFNALRGINAAPDTDDPDFVTEGLFFTTNGQLVNGDAIPRQRRFFSMILVFRVADLSVARTLISNIPDANSDGFSLDVLADGRLSLRAQDGSIVQVLQTAPSTIVEDQWYMATIRVNGRRITLNVNNTNKVTKQLLGYPDLPPDAQEPWIMGAPSVNYATDTTEPGVFAKTLPGRSLYMQMTNSTPGFSTNTHDGFLSYFIYYDRPLEDDEVLAAYYGLANRLDSRNINLPV